jgi:tetratricopeptide (TPR) repeat protein
MRSFTDSLFNLVKDGIITPREAYLQAVDKVSLEQKFSAAGIALDKSATDVGKVNADGTLEMASADMNSPSILKTRAWKLATDRNSQARDGIKAVELIQRAIIMGEHHAESFMILAAAQAESGDFKAAIETVKEALQLAKQENDATCLNELSQHLNYYKKSRPHPGAMA